MQLHEIKRSKTYLADIIMLDVNDTELVINLPVIVSDIHKYVVEVFAVSDPNKTSFLIAPENLELEKQT